MYFFTEPDNLPTLQAEANSYGPVSDDATNKYNTTSKFQLTTESKAFACEKGLMIVQQSSLDESLVNVIIKPNANTKLSVDVQYYVYRSILKNSLIGVDTCIVEQGPTNNELISRIWLDPPTEPDCGTLGYMDNEDTTPVTENIERIFDYDIEGINPILVKEGEWFGTFTKDHKIGFEIVLKTNRFVATLEYARAESYQIDVTGLTNYTERIKREEILNFIDPAAFFGLHYKKKVSYYDTSTNTTKTTSTTTTGTGFIYTKLISKFYTKNKLYLDIRSEKGYSYNFYQNYKVSATDVNNVQVRIDNAYNTQEYQTNNWPLLILEDSDPSDTTNTLRIKLRVDDNIEPILYTKTDLKKTLSNNRAIKSKYVRGLKNGNSTTWTNEFRIVIPNTQSGSSRNYMSNYVKVNYYKAKHNTSSSSSVLTNEYYYDSAFCSIDIPNIGDKTINKRFVESANPIYVREPNNTDGTGNFQLNMNNGAYWDEERILFYATLEYENSEKVSEKEYINTYSQKFEFDTCSRFNEYCDSELYKRTEIICREYTNAGGTVKIPAINFYNTPASKNYKENAMLLGLTLQELETIKTDTQIDDTSHHRFIHLVPSSNNPHITNSIKHFEYELRLQGLDSNGQTIIVTPYHNGAPINLYSRDNQFFSSNAFSIDMSLTTGQNGQNQTNRIEFHIYHDGVVKINDNIDFALIHDLQRIYYKYHGANNVPIVDVFDFEMVMANKMKRRRYQTNPTINDFPISQFPALNTLTFIKDYELEGVNLKTTANGTIYSGVDAGRTYSNASGDILVRPRQNNPGFTGFRWYSNQKSKCFLVKATTNITRNQPPITNNYITSITLSHGVPNVDLEFENTLRLYGEPTLIAAMIGALIGFNNQVTCQGFAYEDASCYPSGEHINGEAADTDYHSTNQLNVDYISALYRFGFNLFRIGNSGHSTSNNIYNNAVFSAVRTRIFKRDSPNSILHRSHLHSTNVILKDGNKTL